MQLIKYPLFVLASLLATFANATDIIFTWNIPTEYVDESPLSVDEISGYNLYQNDEPLISVDGGGTTSVVYNATEYGEFCWTITTVAVDGQESLPSEALCGEVKKPRPNAPTFLPISFGS